MTNESVQQINQRLARAIKTGKQFENLIPVSDCKRIKSGLGNTEFTVNQMVKVVQDYSHQVKKVANKLKKSSFTETLQAIQDFVYWNFQYKIDESDQLLRSPACSFAQRFDGIDCKSYSIIVASILQELGYKSYFRRVTYYPGVPFSHVYNVIPKNQKNGNLEDGYYIIDGTLNTLISSEPSFYKNEDMEIPNELKHYTLAAPAPKGLGRYETMYLQQRGFSGPNALTDYIKRTNPNGLGALTVDSAINFFKNTNFSSFKNLITNFWQSLKTLSCWGGSAYKDSHIKTNLDIIKEMLNEDIKRINTYLADGDFAKMSDEISLTANKYILMKFVVASNLSEGWNSCSTKVQEKQIFILDQHVKTVTDALLEWAKASFVSQTSTKSYTLTHPGHSGGYFMGQGKKMEMINSNATVTWDVRAKLLLSTKPANPRNLAYTGIKPNTKVTFFEATNEINKIFSNADSVSFNPATFLTELQNVATVFYNPQNPGGGNNSGSGNQGGGNNSGGEQYTDTGKVSGMKLAGGALLAVAAIAAGASYMKNEKNKKNEK